MYFILHLTDVLTTTKLSFEQVTQAPCDNFKFVGNSNYITLCLTDNLTMTNFSTLPSNFKVAKMLTSDMFSKVPCGKLIKVMNFVL